MAKKKSAEATAIQEELDAELDGLDLDDELDELDLEDEAVEDEDLTDELDDEEEDEDDDDEPEVKVRTIDPVEDEDDDDEPEVKVNKKRNWTNAKLVEEINGNKTLGYYSPEKPFKTSAARNTAFATLQAAGAKGLTTDEWVGQVATDFEDQGIENSASGSVKFIQKATRRIALFRSGDKWIVIEPMVSGGSRKGYEVVDGKIAKIAKAAKPARKKRARKNADA